MKFIPIHDLETPRLTLRKIRMSDLPQYHARLTSDPEVARWMLWDASNDLAHTTAVIERILTGYTAGNRWHWGIALKETDSLIGTIALLGFDEAEECCSFAYMLGKDFWGKGCGTEALKAVFRFAFQEMQVSQIKADHFEENPASGAAMAKAGMHKICVLPQRHEKNGKFHNAVQYAISREEYLFQAE